MHCAPAFNVLHYERFKRPALFVDCLLPVGHVLATYSNQSVLICLFLPVVRKVQLELVRNDLGKEARTRYGFFNHPLRGRHLPYSRLILISETFAISACVLWPYGLQYINLFGNVDQLLAYVLTDFHKVAAALTVLLAFRYVDGQFLSRK